MKEEPTGADRGRGWRTIAHTLLALGTPCLLLIVAGCASTTPPPTDHVAGSGAVSAGRNPSASSTPPPVKIAGNPNRVYQLKDLKRVSVDLKGHPVKLWLMDDEGKQAEGMMFLQENEVKADEGMLFAFDGVQPKLRSDGQESGFWMHNTLIPLDIIYLSPVGKVIRIAHGKIQDDTSLPAGGDYLNVIELKGGTAARYGLKSGDTVKLPVQTKS